MTTKKLLTVLIAALLSTVCNNIFAYDFAVANDDGVTIYYNYINDGKELEVTYDESLYYKGVVVIPAEVTYMNRIRKVTSIGECAFQRCSGLTSVTIPNSVTSIGGGAFQLCSGLTSINLPNSLKNIGIYAFDSCRKLSSVTIPNSVKSIGEWTFGDCSGLTSVTIGNSVTSIDLCAFRNCSGLTSVTIPNSVKSIGERAFEGCDLTKVVSLIEEPFGIQNNAFSNNTFYNATLYVPVGTIYKYKAKAGWRKFAFIEEGGAEDETPAQVKALPILMQRDADCLTISGTTPGTPIAVYDLSGRLITTATAAEGATRIQDIGGDKVVIVRVGDRSVKVAK